MPWNTDEFADLLHRACRPEPAAQAMPSVRHQPTRRELVRAPASRQAVANVNVIYGFAALLLVGGAIWLALPRSPLTHGAPAVAVALAETEPSAGSGGLASPVLSATAEPEAAHPTAGERGATPPAAVAPLPPKATPRVFNAPAHRVDAQAPRLGAVAVVLPQQPPPTPSAEPAAEPKLAAPAEPLPATGTKLAAVTPPLPAAQNAPAWLRFAVAAPPTEGRPRIAVVIDDLGLDKKRAERAMVLPGPLTLSFLAYAPDLPRLSDAAKRSGHELLVSVPMEPIGRVEDMGPNGLTVGLAHDEMLRRLRWNLDRFEGYVGINNHMGSRFTHDAASLAPVMEELRARGLLFLDARTVGHSAGVDVARQSGVPNAARDVFLDNDVTASAIAAQLAETERVARRHGSAIAIGHARDATIEQLDLWLASLPGKGLALVPVSTIVRERWHEQTN
jgi:polysaccharide deacetylase 2 family uncharacterized protein YibQ